MFSSFQTGGRSRAGSCMMHSAPGAVAEVGVNDWKSEQLAQIAQANANARSERVIVSDTVKHCKGQEVVRVRRMRRSTKVRPVLDKSLV